MALTSTLGAGPLTSSKSFDVDNAKADELVTLFIDGWASSMPEGLTPAQQGQWKLDQAHQKIVDYFRAEINRNVVRANDAQIEALRGQILDAVIF